MELIFFLAKKLQRQKKNKKTNVDCAFLIQFFVLVDFRLKVDTVMTVISRLDACAPADMQSFLFFSVCCFWTPCSIVYFYTDTIVAYIVLLIICAPQSMLLNTFCFYICFFRLCFLFFLFNYNFYMVPFDNLLLIYTHIYLLLH